MSFETERRTIEKHLSDNFTTWPIQFDNVKFTKPANSKWVALTIINGASERITMGPAPYLTRYIGLIVVQAFTPSDSGTSEIRQISQTIGDLYRSKTFTISANEYILTRESTLERVGVDEAAGLYQINTSIPYWRDVNNTT